MSQSTTFPLGFLRRMPLCIDRILDMARTTVNVAGDLMTTTLVGSSEKELDREIYNSDNAQ